MNDYGSGGYLPPVPGPLDPPILQGNPKRKIGILNAGQRRQGVCAAYVTSAVSPKTFCEFLPKYFLYNHLHGVINFLKYVFRNSN